MKLILAQNVQMWTAIIIAHIHLRLARNARERKYTQANTGQHIRQNTHIDKSGKYTEKANMNVLFKHHWIHDENEIPQKHRDILETFERHHLSARLSRSQRRVLDEFLGKNPDTMIHPFFSRAQFTANDVLAIRNMSSYTKISLNIQVYNRIKPALQLASLLLLRHMPLWLLILHGIEIVNPTTGEQTFDEDNFTYNDQLEADFKTVHLPAMQRLTSIGWYRRTSDIQVGMSTMAWSAPASRPWDRQFMLLLSCSSHMWAPFQLNSGWDQLIHEERCTHWVHFAITLVHEFAHCLQFYRHRVQYEADARQRSSYPLFRPDPVLKSWPGSEVGYAFEMVALGGVMDLCSFNDPMNRKFLPSIFTYKGTVIPRMRLLNEPFDDVKDYYHADIAPASMAALMQESTWKDSTGDLPVEIYLWERKTR